MANTNQGASALSKTNPYQFFKANHEGKSLFAVSEDVPVQDALNWAGCLLESVINTLESLAEEHGQEPQFFTAMYLAQMASAAINASNPVVSRGDDHE